jgi:hypothetical protein
MPVATWPIKFRRELLTAAFILLPWGVGLLIPLLALAQTLPAPSRIIPLDAPLDHVQGIDTDGTRLWVSEVDRRARKGRLHEFDLDTGRLTRSKDVTQGNQYHPGGVAADAASVWVPVAEYRALSSSTVLRLSKTDLSVMESFPVADHIGAVAVDGGKVYGANWDARLIYEWPSGQVRLNPTGTRFQDMKAVDGVLIGAGLREGAGAIEWLSLPAMELIRRITTGRTDRGVAFTNEGMTVRGRTLYLLPEDGPSRLFVFELPE